jgi:hypothetical protein
MKQGNSLGGEDSEYYGNIFYRNGRPQMGGPGQHAMYMQNEHGMVRLVDNIVGDNYHLGIHIYAERGHINGFHVEGNVVFSQHGHYNVIVGGYRYAERLTVIDNITYYPASRGADTNLRVGYGGVCLDPMIRGNLSIFGRVTLDGCIAPRFMKNHIIGAPSELQVKWPTNLLLATSYTFSGNTYSDLNFNPFYYLGAAYRSDNWDFSRWQTTFALDEDSLYLSGRPRATQVIVRPNQYEGGRANVVILNWAREESILVDVSQILNPGDKYELRNATAFYGAPLATDIYDGEGTIRVASEVFAGQMPGTGPEFGLFVVRRASPEE